MFYRSECIGSMKRRTFLGSALALFIPTVAIAKQSTETPPISTDEIEFYKFFEKFNGFPINHFQKMMYIWYRNDYGIITMGRQTGCSTFLITLGNWEASKGKTVNHISSNNYLRNIAADKTWSNRNGYGYKNIWLGLRCFHGGKNSNHYDIVLYDNSSDEKMYSKYWECEGPKKFMLVTQENRDKLDFPLIHNL